MKTVFDKTLRDDLIARAGTLDQYRLPQWGKMNAFQMVKHCRLWEEMVHGKTIHKRAFAGLLFGRLALPAAVRDDTPMMKNAVSIPSLIVKETTGDFKSEVGRWIELLEEHAHFSNIDFVHPFFGKMTVEQIGVHAYKHTDHHLRQFSA